MCPMFMKEDAQITASLWEHGPPWPQCNNSNGNTNDPNDTATMFQAAHTHSIPQSPGREPVITPVPQVGTGTSELRPPPEKERKQFWRGLDEVEEAQPELLGIKITQALTM